MDGHSVVGWWLVCWLVGVGGVVGVVGWLGGWSLLMVVVLSDLTCWQTIHQPINGTAALSSSGYFALLVAFCERCFGC